MASACGSPSSVRCSSLAGAVMAFLDSNKVGTTTAGSYGDGYGSSSSTPPPPPPSY
ncbi:MAG: hypothetical protein WKF58_08810 [Ilumatobacteraceae bacterium]